MDNNARALQLIDRIYEAAVRPEAWTVFAEELSVAFGDAAVALSVQTPVNPYDDVGHIGYYTARLEKPFLALARKHVLLGLPWAVGDTEVFLDRFEWANEVFPDEEIAETDFYKEVMEPQGLVAEGPLVHAIHVETGNGSSGLAIYRRLDGRRVQEEDRSLSNLLVPHLSRAFAIQRDLDAYACQRKALTEVLDRLPTGVILLNYCGRPVFVNRTALEMAELEDGLRIDGDSLRLSNRRENAQLEGIIGAAVKGCLTDGKSSGEVMTISRPSTRRPFVALVTSLLPPQQGATTRDAVAALFVGDPDYVRLSNHDVFKSLYSLTGAEAEIVALLAEGNSLCETAGIRGVTMNTARGQLKQVFAKTGTSNQSGLVQLALSGVATIRQQ